MVISSPWKFDVFLSFSQEDTSRNIVNHLYDSLVGIRISTYKDDRQIERDKLLHAIEGSRVAVVVLSEHYASSSRCLEELAKIIECHQKRSLTAIPVFCGVNPSHVRRRTKKFGEYIKKHEQQENPKKVQRWSEALTKLAIIYGTYSRNWNDEKMPARLIRNIITTIKGIVGPLRFEDEVGKNFQKTVSRSDLHDDKARALPEHKPSPSSSSLRNSKVFLSFRERDIRRNFGSFLRKELTRKGLGKFKDEDLPSRGSFWLRLQAIQEARIAVVVLSKNYASSRWCLEELTSIIECRDEGSTTVILIFYEVDPSEVRKQTLKFAKDMKKHEKREYPEKVQRWRDALTKLTDITGEDSQNWKYDSMLIDKIANDIWDALIATTSSSDVSGLVGIDAHMKALFGLLELESINEVRMIGIFGITGVGKTSLVSYLYGKISPYFDTKCFLENVKKIYEDHGRLHLQEELQSKYLQGEAVTIGIPSVGSDAIRSWLRQQRVLLVADNVDSIEQFHIVAKDASWFGPGSRIIITTRNKHLLIAYGVMRLYEVECLGHSEALRLFSLFAFKQDHPPIGFNQLSNLAVELSGGLPLALVILGSTLFGRDKEMWKMILCRSKRPLGITGINKIRSDGLDEEDKSITALRDLDVHVGMDRHMKVMYGLLDFGSSDEVHMIGIWGIGGVGKTTLARYVYKEISQQYPCHYFLENVRKMYQGHGPLWSSSNSSVDLRARLRGQKVLIVVDGVDDIGQLDVIAKDLDWLGVGSRVIITTRDKSLLVTLGVKHFYEVQCLRYDEALQLFCQFAFKQKHPCAGFERFSVRAVQLASRLPLALKLFGSLLHGRGKDDWESVLHRLEALLNKDTVEILKAMD